MSDFQDSRLFSIFWKSMPRLTRYLVPSRLSQQFCCLEKWATSTKFSNFCHKKAKISLVDRFHIAKKLYQQKNTKPFIRKIIDKAKIQLET